MISLETEDQFIMALSNCMLEVLKPVGVDTLIIFTTTELDVDVHPVLVK